MLLTSVLIWIFMWFFNDQTVIFIYILVSLMNWKGKENRFDFHVENIDHFQSIQSFWIVYYYCNIHHPVLSFSLYFDRLISQIGTQEKKTIWRKFIMFSVVLDYLFLIISLNFISIAINHGGFESMKVN